MNLREVKVGDLFVCLSLDFRGDLTIGFLVNWQSLRAMNHSNIIKLKEVIKEYGDLYFVFEYMVNTLSFP